MARLLDEKGFVRPGNYILAYFPAYKSVLGFKVKARRNEGFEYLDYGHIPYTFGAIGTEGIMESETSTDQYKFPWIDNRISGGKKTNMFYYESDSMLLHPRISIKPIQLMQFIYLQQGQLQSYLNNYDIKVDMTGFDYFGYWRNTEDFLFLPKLEMTFRTYNPTNARLRTRVDMMIAEYETELVQDKQLLKNMWNEKVPTYRHTIPTYAKTVIGSMLDTYGIKSENEFMEEFGIDKILGTPVKPTQPAKGGGA